MIYITKCSPFLPLDTPCDVINSIIGSSITHSGKVVGKIVYIDPKIDEMHLYIRDECANDFVMAWYANAKSITLPVSAEIEKGE